jgi:YVTN family beta-propeller protein
MNVNFKNTRISLVLLALVASLTACNKPADTDTAAKADGLQANTKAAAGDAANKGVAYVTSQDAGVSVIDLATMKVVKTFDVKAAGPRGLGVTDDGKKLIVATRENESISVIDTATGEVLQQIPVGKNPEFVRVKGNFAYISSEPSAKAGPPPKPGSAEAEDDDDDEEKIPAKIAVVDLIKGEKVREITGGPETEGIEFSADGKNLVITNEADNTVTVHNIESGELVKTVKTHEHGDRPRGIKVSPDGNTYLATLEYGNNFMVLDKDFNVVRTVPTGDTPYGISYDAAGKYIYVASNKSQLLEVFAADNFVKIKEAPTAKRCWHFTFTPDNKQILLACGKSDAVLVYDAETFTQTGQIEVKNLPWGIVTYPKAMGSLDAAAK